MLSVVLLAAITAAFTAPAIAAPIQRPPSCDAQAILQRVGNAIGGHLPHNASSLSTTGTTSANGIVSQTREVVDLANGRFSRDESGSVRSSRVVFDGRTVWARDWTGGVHPLNGVDATRGALTDAYLRRYGYLHRHWDPATFGCVAAGVDSPYAVVSIVPKGGREVRLWIDRRTGLVSKTMQRTPTSSTTTTFDDYREVNGFVLPFMVRSTDGSDTSTTLIHDARFQQTPLPSSFFAVPTTTNPGEIVGGAGATTIPLLVENGQALLEADVHGHRLLFQLDTGGHAILTPEAARLIGLHPFGTGASGGGGEGTTAQQYTAGQTLRIGQARMEHVPFYVIAYGRDFSDRGRGRAARAGILGLEIFERFAVRLDYQHCQLTLTPLQHFGYQGRGTPLRLTFEEDTPLVEGRADTSPGVFQLDTGNSGGTLLFGPFLRAHHFYRTYPVGFDSSGFGTGGQVKLRTRRLHSFAVDGLALENFVTYFVDERTGAFSSLTEAGNIGYDVLSQFTITLDYRHLVAYAEALAVPRLPAYNRAGLGVEREAGRLLVDKVLPDSPAASAGIALSDVLVGVNGRDGAEVSAEAFRGLTRAAIGSLLKLQVQHQGHVRRVDLRLRELLCTSVAGHCSPAVRHIATSRRLTHHNAASQKWVG